MLQWSSLASSLATATRCRRCASTLREQVTAVRQASSKSQSTRARAKQSTAGATSPRPLSRRRRLASTNPRSSSDSRSLPSTSTEQADSSKVEATTSDVGHARGSVEYAASSKLKRRPRKAKSDSRGSEAAIESPDTRSFDNSTEAKVESDIVDITPPEHVPVPHLAHGLDRVLFNPGVYYLQDPRSHVYNFDPYLQQITPVKDFNFDALTEYITSSRDSTLDELARKHGLKVVGSTSSMTGVLTQFHYLVSNHRPVNLRRLSTVFAKKSKQFTMAQRAPASIYLRYNNGIYAIDADKSMDSGETVLSFLGRSMEKMLTLDPEEFSKLKKENSAEAPTEKSREAYHYSKLGSILMRSQLDCTDPRLPGSGTFDLKTRAVLPVRMNVKNAHEGAGYQILQSTGLLESFEREYYDMIRAAFLKYSLQVRIGKMDGIFVAYHNTERIFGFQYISIEEMDECIHGSSDQNIAHREFLMSLKQLDKVLEMAIQQYPGQSMSLTFEALEGKTPSMDIVIEPLSEEEVQRRQKGELLEALKAAQKNERIKKMPSSSRSTNSKGTLENMSSTLERMISSGGKPQPSPPTKEQEDSASSTTAAPTDSAAGLQTSESGSAATKGSTGKLMFHLKGTNMIDGKPVSGPPDPSATSSWVFKYQIQRSHDAAKIDATIRSMRDKQALAFTDIFDSEEDKASPFLQDLKKMSDLGRIKLEKSIERQTGSPPVVFREASTRRDLERQYKRTFHSEYNV